MWLTYDPAETFRTSRGLKAGSGAFAGKVICPFRAVLGRYACGDGCSPERRGTHVLLDRKSLIHPGFPDLSHPSRCLRLSERYVYLFRLPLRGVERVPRNSYVDAYPYPDRCSLPFKDSFLEQFAQPYDDGIFSSVALVIFTGSASGMTRQACCTGIRPGMNFGVIGLAVLLCTGRIAGEHKTEASRNTPSHEPVIEMPAPTYVGGEMVDVLRGE
jgi:hypothetical protein